jgi:hypothetical protein
MDHEDEIVVLLREIRDELRANRAKYEGDAQQSIELTRQSQEAWERYRRDKTTQFWIAVLVVCSAVFLAQYLVPLLTQR